MINARQKGDIVETIDTEAKYSAGSVNELCRHLLAAGFRDQSLKLFTESRGGGFIQWSSMRRISTLEFREAKALPDANSPSPRHFSFDTPRMTQWRDGFYRAQARGG